MKNILISISYDDDIPYSTFLDIKQQLFLIKELNPELYIFYITDENSEVIK